MKSRFVPFGKKLSESDAFFPLTVKDLMIKSAFYIAAVTIKIFRFLTGDKREFLRNQRAHIFRERESLRFDKNVHKKTPATAGKGTRKNPLIHFLQISIVDIEVCFPKKKIFFNFFWERKNDPKTPKSSS